MKITYEISQIVPYINWVYFYYAWGIHSRPEAEQQKLRQEAEEALQQIEDRYHTYALFELYEACSDGDDIMVSRGVGSEACSVRIPCLRQQQGNPPFTAFQTLSVLTLRNSASLQPLWITALRTTLMLTLIRKC